MKISRILRPPVGLFVALANLWLIFGIGLGFSLVATRIVTITSAFALVASLVGMVALGPEGNRVSRILAYSLNTLAVVLGLLVIVNAYLEIGRGVGLRLTTNAALLAAVTCLFTILSLKQIAKLSATSEEQS